MIKNKKIKYVFISAPFVTYGTGAKKSVFFKIDARANMDWDPTMQVAPWVGFLMSTKAL